MIKPEVISADDIICYHCGDICKDNSITQDEKSFCCQGCKTVFEILAENKLCKYYTIEDYPGISPKSIKQVSKYEYLEDEQTRTQILDFTDGIISTVTFRIPQMHCSSCIWLLENLYKFNSDITYSRVDFVQKKLTIKYSERGISLKEIVILLEALGYEPQINHNEVDKGPTNSSNKSLYYKIGIAGFAFGNIMLYSFPDYLSITTTVSPGLRIFFGYLSLFLSLPVVFYCSSDYFTSAFKGLRKRFINIDFPISLGISVLFLRSLFEIVTQYGTGYLDSLSGLVFFLLLGKLFQSKTYETLNFERNYKSYFPLSVTTTKFGKETTIPVSKLKKSNRIVIRNQELIPADAILFKGDASIDYSFVTGESLPVNKVLGEIIYAGGRQCGSSIELEVIKDVSQSYLTQLWNNEIFKKKDSNLITGVANSVAKYFTFAVLLIAIASGVYWFSIDVSTAFNVFTAVLIIACPCALALSVPFTLGNSLRIFGKNKFYLKNTSVIEQLSKIKTIVFDKTGTITKSGSSELRFIGLNLIPFEKSLIKSLVRQSTHTLSKIVYDSIDVEDVHEVTDFNEIFGKGISGKILSKRVVLGSEFFVTGGSVIKNNIDKGSFGSSSKVYVSINNDVKGYFNIENSYREGLKEIINNLRKDLNLYLLSGDNENEKNRLIKIFGDSSRLFFKHTPESKLEFVKSLQTKNDEVLMFGDGLNDAGALKQSNVGISISENVTSFSPACDAILEAENFSKIESFIRFSHTSMKLIIVSFIISFVYNAAGLSLAVQGLLSPIVAAILMPISSISVVLFAVLSTNFFARRKGLL